MNSDAKLETVKQEIERLNINVLEIYKSKWKETGITTSDNYTRIHSGGENCLGG